MLIVISPAKTLDFDTKPATERYTLPVFLNDSALLIEKLRKLTVEDLTKLMNISYGLAEKNLERFLSWHLPFTPNEAKQAVLAFKGDVYQGLNAEDFTEDDFDMAQNHLRILSGLYGILRPLDLILPYRLEMGTKLKNDRGKNLYEFWGDKITDQLNSELEKHPEKVLVNLASNEYFKAIKTKKVTARIVTPVFKEYKNGSYRVISFYAKKARGLMSRFIIKKRIKNIEDIKKFDSDRYRYSEEMSTADHWIFIR